MKKVLKRTTIVFTVLCMLLVATFTVAAATTDKDFVIENGVLKDYLGNEEVINIPEGVSKIAEGAFEKLDATNDLDGVTRYEFNIHNLNSDRQKLRIGGFPGKKIVLPTTVKEIEPYAFPDTVEELVLNEGLEIIHDHALRDVNDIVIELPTTVKKIGKDAFSPAVIKVVGQCKEVELMANTFEDDANLRVVELKGVKNIPDGLFASCRKLKRVSMVGEYATVTDKAFAGAKNLRQVVTSKAITGDIRANCKNLKAEDVKVTATPAAFDDFFIENKKLIEYTGNTTQVTIPKGVTTIGEYAFANNHNIQKVVMPNSVKTIEKNAFYYCERLTSVKFSTKLKTIGNNAFAYCTNIKKYNLSKSLKTIGNGAFTDNYSLTKITIPAKVKVVKKNTFRWCINLKNVKLNKKVKTIGKGAFSFTALKKINLANVTTVEKNAFQNTKLVKINLKSAKKIGKGAFTHVKTAKTIKVRKNAKIAKNAFYGVKFKKAVKYVK